jgi:alpha-N-arabinofuranosidase
MSPTITIDPTATIGRINPNLFGYFVEHLGRSVYGGIYEPGSPRADADGFRLDVLEAVRELATTTVRYPGGNFVSGYHWRDGVGPREQRPVRYEHAWKAVETNAFGTHEFMTWARRLGTVPYFCVNLGNGTPQEAAEWLEYCNGAVDTSLTRLRAANGAPDPFAIPIWGLGNELYGHWQIGCKSASAYAEVALEAARRMREVDPTVQLVACGWENSSSWNATVLDALAPNVDYLSLHLYIGRNDFPTAMAQPLLLEQLSRWHAGLARLVCRERGLTKTLPLAWDEWNVWFEEQTSPVAGKELYTLRDALAVAGCLNALVRCSDVVALANLAILVNVIAPIYAGAQGMFRQTIFWPLTLYRRLAGWRSLRPSIQCDGYRAQYAFRGWAIDEEIPYLDVAAALAPDERTLMLGVVNRQSDAAIDAELRLVGMQPAATCLAETVGGPETTSYNSLEQPDLVGVTRSDWAADAHRPRYSFAPHSVTMLTIPLG